MQGKVTMSGEYEYMRRVCYDSDEYGLATFIPVCELCGRFVKADESILVGENGLSVETNATCKKCGRTHMIFEGFF